MRSFEEFVFEELKGVISTTQVFPEDYDKVEGTPWKQYVLGMEILQYFGKRVSYYTINSRDEIVVFSSPFNIITISKGDE